MTHAPASVEAIQSFLRQEIIDGVELLADASFKVIGQGHAPGLYGELSAEARQQYSRLLRIHELLPVLALADELGELYERAPTTSDEVDAFRGIVDNHAGMARIITDDPPEEPRIVDYFEQHGSRRLLLALEKGWSQ